MRLSDISCYHNVSVLVFEDSHHGIFHARTSKTGGCIVTVIVQSKIITHSQQNTRIVG